jgi:hypothetical protein
MYPADHLKMVTNATWHLSTNEFVDVVAVAEPGDRIVYARGDLSYSASPFEAHELRGLRALAYDYWLGKRGYLFRMRRPDILFKPKSFRPGPAFDYILVVQVSQLSDSRRMLLGRETTRWAKLGSR